MGERASIAFARVYLSAYFISIPMGIPQAKRVSRIGSRCIISMRYDAVTSPGTVELVASSEKQWLCGKRGVSALSLF